MAKGFGPGLGMSRGVSARHKACSVRRASLSPPGLVRSGSLVVAICTQERWSARSGRCSTPTERRARRDAPSCCAQRSASLVWPSRNTVFPTRFNNHVQISRKHYLNQVVLLVVFWEKEAFFSSNITVVRKHGYLRAASACANPSPVSRGLGGAPLLLPQPQRHGTDHQSS